MDIGLPHNIPPVTGTLLLLAVTSVVLVSFGLVHPLQLVFSSTLTFQERQYWRLITTFFYFGRVNLESIIEFHWLYLVSSSIEQQYFRLRKLDYCFTILTGMLLLLGVRTLGIIDSPYLSFVFCRSLTYLFCRLFPEQEVGLFGLLMLRVRLLPIVFLVIGTILDDMRGIKADIVANLVGHILWYLLEIFPRITKLHPLRLQHYFF
ncbi:putative DER1-like protein [Trypanosoma theileri]|uniref:Derlin n=1 Tax=Trypanosoma theileri TaxID=67003 RepID=A0A1X0P505_9TRYP|nr:putative DER1-like protein [Trypanosoma theileri]ORC91520.1 putative DER1-like protein [Trypanosoma theileri]